MFFISVHMLDRRFLTNTGSQDPTMHTCAVGESHRRYAMARRVMVCRFKEGRDSGGYDLKDSRIPEVCENSIALPQHRNCKVKNCERSDALSE